MNTTPSLKSLKTSNPIFHAQSFNALGFNTQLSWLNRIEKQALAMSLLLLVLLPLQAAANFDHSSWNDLLQQYVIPIDEGVGTQVDYGGFAAAKSELQDYLDALSAVQRSEFDAWTQGEQLAFLINTYNASTVSLILTEYPNLDSIKDIGGFFRSPWKQEFIPLFGELVSLDNIEHDMIRGWDRYQEPRIHFAVNCAAIGCPALRNEAYEGGSLDEQLEDSTRRFLADRARNYYANNRLWISNIFNWYEEDFERGWQGIESVSQFLSYYAEALGLSKEVQEALANEDVRIRHLRYDWDLNRVPES